MWNDFKKFISRGKGRHITRVMESHELIAVLSGELNMFEEERYFRIRSGEYLILQRGRKHGGLTNYSANLSFFWIHFLDDDIVAEVPQSGKLSELGDETVITEAIKPDYSFDTTKQRVIGADEENSMVIDTQDTGLQVGGEF